MILLGITGAIEHGKTTFGDYLAEIEPNSSKLETSALISEFATAFNSAAFTPKGTSIDELNRFVEPVPELVERILHQECSFGDIRINERDLKNKPAEYKKLLSYINQLQKNPGLLRAPITVKNKTDYRDILQWFGGYLIEKIDKAIWYNELLRRADKECAKGKELCIIGGLRYPRDSDLVHSKGGTVIDIHRPGYKETELTDPTERERKLVQYNSQVINDGSLDDLRSCARRVLADIKNGALKKQYKCSAPL